MKRLALSAVLALAIHGLLLTTKAEWLLQKSARNPTPIPISFTLAYQEPIKPILPPEKWLKSPPPPLKGEPPETKIEPPPVQPPKPEPVQETKKVMKVATRPKKLVPPRKPKQPPPEPKKQTKPEPRPDPLPSSEFEFFSSRDDQEVKEVRDSLHEPTPMDTQEAYSETKDALASVPPSPPVREAIPVYRENPYPYYPRIARRRGYEGTVTLEVLVNRNGRVRDLRVLTSSGYEVLDQAALASVKDWLFEPGMRGNQKVAMWVKIPVRFQLKK